jgi:hypothetical protein
VYTCFQYEFSIFKGIIFNGNTLNTSVHDNDNILQLNENLKPLIKTVNCVTVQLCYSTAVLQYSCVTVQLCYSTADNTNSDMFRTVRLFTESRNTRICENMEIWTLSHFLLRDFDVHSWPEHQLYWGRFIVDFLSTSTEVVEIFLKLYQESFLPQTFKSLIGPS